MAPKASEVLTLFGRFYQPADTRPTDLLKDMDYAGMDRAELLAIIERFYTPNKPFDSLEDVERANEEFRHGFQALSKAQQQTGKMLIKPHDNIIKVWKQRTKFLSSEQLRLTMALVRKRKQQERAEALAAWVSFMRQLSTPKQKVVRSSGSGSSSSSNESSFLHPGYYNLRVPLLDGGDANC